MTTDRDTVPVNMQPLAYGNLYGGPGNDYIFGPRTSAGSYLDGGHGDDKIFSETASGFVIHVGGNGDDIIYGGDDQPTETKYYGDFTISETNDDTSFFKIGGKDKIYGGDNLGGEQ